MTNWQGTKTNWTAAEAPTDADVNRWEINDQHLKEKVDAAETPAGAQAKADAVKNDSVNKTTTSFQAIKSVLEVYNGSASTDFRVSRDVGGVKNTIFLGMASDGDAVIGNVVGGTLQSNSLIKDTADNTWKIGTTPIETTAGAQAKADTRVAKSGDTMTGSLIIDTPNYTEMRVNRTISSIKYGGVLAVDGAGVPLLARNVNGEAESILRLHGANDLRLDNSKILTESTGVRKTGDTMTGALNVENWMRSLRNTGKSLSTINATDNHADRWNDPNNTNAFFANNNQALAIIVGGTLNDRNVMLQAGHISGSSASVLGVLRFNPLGGSVTLNKNGFIFELVESHEHRLMKMGNVALKGLNGGGNLEELQIRNPTDTDYRDFIARNIRHTGSISSSRREWKKNIESYEGDALERINTTPVREYHMLNDDDRELKRIGFILDEIPFEMADIRGNGVEMYATTALIWKGVQELSAKVEEQRSIINNLLARVEVLEAK